MLEFRLCCYEAGRRGLDVEVGIIMTYLGEMCLRLVRWCFGKENGEEGCDVVIYLWEMRSKMMGDEDRFVKGEGGRDMAL